MDRDFWRKWLESGAEERMYRLLPLAKKFNKFLEIKDRETRLYVIATLLQEYFEELEEVLKGGQFETKLLDFIELKSNQSKCVSLEEIIKYGRTLGLEEEQVRNLLRKLKSEGLIYEPRSKCYASAI